MWIPRSAGSVTPRSRAVRDAFAENFAERGEVGAAVCVIVDGQVVVDLVGGWADEARQRPWQHDTLVNFYSVGKAFVALLALQLVDAGVIGLDDPIATVWPEFAAAGKDDATIRHALCHRAGVPAIRERLTNDDLWNWERMTDALAATEPWWEPGTRHTYHTNTYGHLVGEIVRRASGDMPGTRLRAVADSIGADVWCGVPASQQHRCADVLWAPANAIPRGDITTLSGESLMLALGYFNPPGYSSTGVVNTAEWRSAQVPSTNGHGSASGVARDVRRTARRPTAVVRTAGGGDARPVGRLLPGARRGRHVRARLQAHGAAPSVRARTRGASATSAPAAPSGIADPDARVAFGYVMNHVIPRWQSTRNRALPPSTPRSDDSPLWDRAPSPRRSAWDHSGRKLSGSVGVDAGVGVGEPAGQDRVVLQGRHPTLPKPGAERRARVVPPAASSEPARIRRSIQRENACVRQIAGRRVSL